MATPKASVILQPTFLPWLGWFDLADQSDILVILDDVQFSKQSWQQRNRIRTQSGLDFLTIPVKTSGRLGQLIRDCEFSDTLFVEKMIRSLQMNYARTPFFADYFGELSERMRAGVATGRLVELNCMLIEWIADKLDIRTPMVRSSTLDVGGQRGERVAAICERVESSFYLSPAGAEDYLRDDFAAFERRKIKVALHVYEHPVYRQGFQPFIPYASAVDLLFNTGPAASAILRSGRRAGRPLVVSTPPE